jgi:hypothetical protein
MDFKIGVVAISLAGEQRFDLALLSNLVQRPKGIAGFADDLLVALVFGKLDQPDGIIEFGWSWS